MGVRITIDQGVLESIQAGLFFSPNNSEVYIDERKKTYRDLEYKRFNLLNIWAAIMSRISRAAQSEAKRRGITGNLSGDGLQNGGVLIVSKAGTRLLLNHREQLPGDHVTNDEVLKVLGITEVKPSR